MPKILIVDDEELNVDLLVQLLEDEYEVVTAYDGRAGVALAKQEEPDLILMDLLLPEIDGYEAIRQIRADQRLQATPIIVLTAHAMKGVKEQAQQAGCDDYVTKPLDEDALFAKLEQFLGK